MNAIKLPKYTNPPLWLSVIPIALLLTLLAVVIVIGGASKVQEYSHYILSASAAVCLLLGCMFTTRTRAFLPGIAKSSRQILPTVPLLLFIGTLSATWMLSGVVPLFIHIGLGVLNPSTFLFVTCLTCAVVSVVTGSSWTTIATIGVALMGVGSVMGYHPGWVAGAIISGAYFGDKVSPLSDTTVLAASTCGVPLFTHIRYLMLTTVPAMSLALIVYLLVGMNTDLAMANHSSEISQALAQSFNLTPWVLIIPAITLIMIALRLGTATTLGLGSVTGLIGIILFQPQVFGMVGDSSPVMAATHILFTSTAIDTGSELLNPLVSTGGMAGMLPTVYLVLSAMVFGGAMIGTGMLGTITHSITSRLNRTHSIVGTTVCSGLFLNSCTGDQYLSIIIGGNIFRNTFRHMGLKPQALSRTLEDSVSVTSVLIPWNSCGVTQSTVLGVATLVYLPFCLFNILSPIMTMVMAWTGWRMQLRPEAG